MDQMRRWKVGTPGSYGLPMSLPKLAPVPLVVLPIGEWWVWTIVRDNRMVNQVNRWPNVEF